MLLISVEKRSFCLIFLKKTERLESISSCRELEGFLLLLKAS